MKKRILLGLIIMVGILAIIIIPQIGYIISSGAILDFTLWFGVILLFGFAFGAIWVIGLILQALFGTDSGDTSSIRDNSPRTSRTSDSKDCWGSCMDEVDRHLERMIESQDQAWREYQHEMQTQYREAEEKKMEREREMWEEMRREHEG